MEIEKGRNGSHCVENLLWKEMDLSYDGLHDDDDDDNDDDELITVPILFFSFQFFSGAFEKLAKGYY
jgi:hypothetical protein